MDINRKKEKNISLPKKRVINLAKVGEKTVNKKMAVPAILVIVLLACLISKVLVVDQLTLISKKEAEVNQLKTEIEKNEAIVEKYSNISDAYAHYTYEGMTDEEKETVDRTAVLNLIDDEVLPYAQVGAWKLSGNVLELPISSTDLEDTNKIVEKLEKDQLVDYVTVANAVLDEQTKTVLNSDELSKYKSDVTATITVYLTRNKEEAK